MSAGVVSFARFASLKGFGPHAATMGLAAGFLFVLAGCASYQRQGVKPPLVQAERRLALAEKGKFNPEEQGAEYLAVAQIARGEIAKARPGAPLREPSEAIMVYNRAAADLAAVLPALLRQQQQQRPGTFALRDPQTGGTLRLRLGSDKPGEYPASFFQQILAADRINKKGLNDNVTRKGLGGAVVGVHQSSPAGSPPPRLEPLKGFRVSMTTVIDFSGAGPLAVARLRLLDPDRVDRVDLDQNRYPVTADYSAPYASYGRINETWLGFVHMTRGEHMRGGSGLLLLQPYDPAKIPVVFVHGLLSSAYTWRNVANSLTADPEIRRHYQFWIFSYSTGNPITYSALLLREDLAYAQQTYGIKQLMLIGHSMGGILSRLQVTTFGRETWNEAFGPKADQLYAELPDNSVVKRALLFHANPAVKRVIFVATPHRGSSIATGGIGALGVRLIRLPSKVAAAIPGRVLAALAPPNREPRKYQLPTSISGLSPKSPLLLAMDKLPIEAPHNSIIGDRGRGDTLNSSDGVVPYWSSHLDSAQSELIVPTDHGAMKHPHTVAEIRRILLEQIGKKSPRVEMPKQVPER